MKLSTRPFITYHSSISVYHFTEIYDLKSTSVTPIDYIKTFRDSCGLLPLHAKSSNPKEIGLILFNQYTDWRRELQWIKRGEQITVIDHRVKGLNHEIKFRRSGEQGFYILYLSLSKKDPFKKIYVSSN